MHAEITMTDSGDAKETESADVRGILYSLLANAFRYPDDTLLKTLLDPQRWSALPPLVRGLDAESAAQLEAIGERWVEPIRAGSTGFDDDALQNTYVHLFGHTVRGTCPMYELEYGRGEIIQQTSILADIAGFYSAFGMELTGQGNERPDHVTVECEFMSILAAKEAYAMRHEDDAEAREILKDAQRSFLEEHLARWLPSLLRRITEADPNGFYGAMASFGDAFLDSECRRYDVPRGSKLLELRPVDPTHDANINCGPEACVPAGQASPLVQLGIDASQQSPADGGPASE